MLKLEKVKLTSGLNTDVSPKAIDTAGNRLVTNPLIDALNARYIETNNGDFIFESVRGNVKVTNAGLPGSGTNKQIGSFEDLQNNVLLFWVYNSASHHCIFQYSIETGLISTLINNAFLNFQNDPRYLITGIGVQGDLIYFSDGYNPQRVINRTRDYSAITSDKPITLIKEHPTTRPDVIGTVTIPQGHPFFRGLDATIRVNKIADKSLQFSYQYIFIDNEKSVIAPFSKLAYASINPSVDIDVSDHNVIQYRHTIPSDIYPWVKAIRLLVRENNSGSWNIWRKIYPTSSSIVDNYTGYEPLEALSDSEQIKIQEAVPTVSKALAVHRNRIIASDDQEGFDVNLSSGAFPISLSLTETFESYRVGPSLNTYFKRGGSRTFALALFDERGRSMGIFGKTNIKFTPADDVNNVSDNFETDSQRAYVRLVLSGSLLSAAPKAAYYSIVCTDEEYYEDYIQVPVLAFFYKYERGAFALGANEYGFDGRVYSSAAIATYSQFNKMHLLLPKEAAIIPTDEYLVKLFSKRNVAPYSTAKLERVIGVKDSQFVVVNNFGIQAWGANPGVFFAEIFKVRQTPPSIFYEISDRMPLIAGVPSTTNFTIYGDTYYVTDHKFNFRQIKAETSGAPFTITVIEKTASIESPSPTFGFKSILESYNEPDANPEKSVINTILDYTKKAWNQGKTFVELPNPIQLNRSNVIRFSNQFLQDSSINGLSSFDSGDEYPLPVTRTPIKKLVPVGNNVLAIHERSMTTLYVEQSMIKNAEGAEQLITTDKFIGYDRELQTKIGAYHAESVQEHMGSVFGFDVFKGIAWQYTNEGISEISKFGRKNYFQEKAQALLPYKDTAKVLSGIDPVFKEFYLSFVFPSGHESQNETVAYNWEKNIWTVRYSAVPEGYAKINTKLISFKDGELWVHGENSLYNNFYGVQYERRLKVAVNPYPSRSKNFMGIQIATNLLSSGIDPEMKVVQCFTEDGQETYMKVDDFESQEGVWYGPVLKNINTLGALIEAGQIALRNGEDMLGKYLTVELINDHTTDPCPVQFINISYVDSEYSQ